jgi:UDP-N-acetylmuramate dehydrogenase
MSVMNRPDTVSVEAWCQALQERLGTDTVKLDVPLAPLTTFRIGGPADLFVEATSPDQLAACVTAARELGLPYFLLGRGANVLVSDAGFRGLVIRSRVAGVEFLERGRVRAGSGVDMFPDLILASVGRGLGGLHHFVGIPSTVGGALWQNLHFLSPPPHRERTVFIEEVLESAEILTEDGERKRVGEEYFRFGYDYSILHDRADTVLSATFRLVPERQEVLRKVMRANLEWRDERHPDLWLFPSAGSVFKKVESIGAGRLIDECGLKGEVRGGAQISRRHANIIVNVGGGSAADVMGLIELCQEVVLRETGHMLTPEITLVGEF